MILYFKINQKNAQDSNLNTFLSNNHDFIHKSGIIECKFCNFSLRYSSRKGISPLKQHLLTKKHEKSKELHQAKCKYKNDDKEIHIKFLNMMVKTNIPFKVCDNELFRDFCALLGFNIRSSTYYREHLLVEVAKIKLNNIYDKFITQPWYLMLDETQDRKQQSILNMLIGTINSKKYEKPKLLFSGKILDTKSETISKIVDSVINPLFKYNYSKSNFKVFLTDGASYCRKLGKIFKEKYGCLHLVCICHNIHNFAEYLRGKYGELNYLISFLKRVLVKNKKNKEIWRATTGIKLPDWPIITRWELGSIVEFIYQYILMRFLNLLNPLKTIICWK